MNKELEKIQQAQDLYNQWVELLPELEKSFEQWKKATDIIEQLGKFYFSDKWRDLHDNADQYKIDTKGNYSVLSEDAVWNAVHEKRELDLQWLKAIVAKLD
ncbi:DUF4298 domain-containing protein [Seminibacterium arietis]|uniref:DUF4298 domain-containing protein n=1 Tax=Seminibacterium arietis TaxID=1173502 RepID=A0ABW3I7W1_9PAST